MGTSLKPIAPRSVGSSWARTELVLPQHSKTSTECLWKRERIFLSSGDTKGQCYVRFSTHALTAAVRHSVESDKTDRFKKIMFPSKSACSQAQKLLYSPASLEMPKRVLQDSKIVVEFKVMKSLSPWNKACRFLNSTETFPSSKSLNPTVILRRGVFFTFVSWWTDCGAHHGPLCLPLCTSWMIWEFGTEPGRFRLHFLLHPKCFEVICQSALHSLHPSKEGPLVLEKNKKKGRHNCGIVITAQNWGGEKTWFCS